MYHLRENRSAERRRIFGSYFLVAHMETSFMFTIVCLSGVLGDKDDVVSVSQSRNRR